MASAPTTGANARSKLETIEVARGLAALAVVVFHANASARHFGGQEFDWLRPLEHGVDFFFVLSGFVIMTAHANEIGQPSSVLRYLMKRAIRVFPILWAVVLLYAIGRTYIHGFDAALVFRSLFPYPSLAETAPVVVWTLRHEIFFYLMFAALLFSRRWGVVLFMAWMAAVAIQLVLALLDRPVTGIASFYLSTYVLDFTLGMALAMLHRRWRFKDRIWPLVGSLVLLAGYLSMEDDLGLVRFGTADYVSPGATLGVLILGLIFLLVIHGLLRMENAWRVPRFLLALGSASYALYLIHTPVNSAVQRVVARFPDVALAWGAGQLLLVIGGLLVAFAIHYLFEKPTVSFLRLRLAGNVGAARGFPEPVRIDGECRGNVPSIEANGSDGGSVNWFSRMFGRRREELDADFEFTSSEAVDVKAADPAGTSAEDNGVPASNFLRGAGRRAKADNLPRFSGGGSGRGLPHGQVERMRQLRAAFTPSYPISDATLFAGRRDLLLRLIHLIEDQKLHVVLYGDRGIGKTSVLRILSGLAREAHYNVTYASCGSDTDFDSLFRSLAREVPLLFHADYEPTSPEVEAGGVFADLLPDRAVTVADLTSLFESVRGTQLLVIIDEFDRVESNRMREQVAELIKNLSDRGVAVQCLIAGVASNLTALVSHIPSIRRNLIGLPIGPLNDGELREMLENVAARSGVPFSEGAEAMMIRFSNGLPYLTQLLGLHASQAAVHGGEMVVSESDVMVAVGHAVDEIRLRISARGLRSADQVAQRIGWGRLGELACHAMLQVGNLAESDLAGLDPLSIEELLASHVDEDDVRWSFKEEAVVPYAWLQAKQEENTPARYAAARSFQQLQDADLKQGKIES